MPIGFDATTRTAPTALRGAEVNVICRYIAPQSWKVIKKPEYDELVAAGYIPGFTLFLNWESAAADWNDGTGGGAEDGNRAVLMARAIGYPAGATIIGSADYDHKNLDTVKAYGIAFKAAIEAGGYKAGVYGPWDVLTVCKSLGFAFYWQCMSTAYSGGRNHSLHPATNLWQKGYKTIGGVQGDYSEIIRLANPSAPSTPAPLPNEVVAMNKNQEALLKAVFNLEPTVTLYDNLHVLPTWNISTWVSDLNKQGNNVTWQTIKAFNPGIMDNVDLATNTFQAEYDYINPVKFTTVPSPLFEKLSAGTGASVSVDLEALATLVAGKLHELTFKA